MDLPLHFHIKYTAACSAVKLCKCGCWIVKSYGYSNILDVALWEFWAFPTQADGLARWSSVLDGALVGAVGFPLTNMVIARVFVY